MKRVPLGEVTSARVVSSVPVYGGEAVEQSTIPPEDVACESGVSRTAGLKFCHLS